MGFGGPIIKEGLILVISIVTLQNYYGDLGESCGKYPGWVKVPGPFDICHFWTQLTILFTFIKNMGFGGPVIKEGLTLVISIVTLQYYYGDLGEVCGKYPGWVKVPGPFDIRHFFTQLTILFTYIETYGFWGSRYKRRSNFSYVDCYTPQLLWRPRWGTWQYPGWVKVPGPFDICHFWTQLTILFTFIENMGFWGPVIKEGLSLVI